MLRCLYVFILLIVLLVVFFLYLKKFYFFLQKTYLTENLLSRKPSYFVRYFFNKLAYCWNFFSITTYLKLTYIFKIKVNFLFTLTKRRKHLLYSKVSVFWYRFVGLRFFKKNKKTTLFKRLLPLNNHTDTKVKQSNKQVPTFRKQFYSVRISYCNKLRLSRFFNKSKFPRNRQICIPIVIFGAYINIFFIVELHRSFYSLSLSWLSIFYLSLWFILLVVFLKNLFSIKK